MQQLERPATGAPAPDAPPGGAADPLASDFALGAAPRRSRRRRRLIALGLVVAALVVVGAVLSQGAAPGRAAPTAAPPTQVPYDARGKVVPIAQARVVSLQGGVVRALHGQPGTAVAEREELARVETATGGVEVLVAPFAGTLLAVPVQVGDGLLPGTLVAAVGDLSALRVETTDVDEYLVASLRVGQPVEITVDALGASGRPTALTGRITGITLLPQASPTGDQHYPVLVTLDRADPALRPGMSARLRFGRSGRG
jgi:hypothetical protein